jgi:hypothetical protein
MDPFILEQRAYERIYQVYSDAEKAFFPKYYGAINTKEMSRAIVLEYMRSSVRSRCVFSASVPLHLKTNLKLLKDDLDAFEREERDGTKRRLSLLEKKWCESLFIDRLKRLTTLHSIGVTHGDIKEDHFRLFGDDFHDTVLFDFSRAYTFTLHRPYMVQACIIYSRFADRVSTFCSMQKIVQMERDWVRNLIHARQVSYIPKLCSSFRKISKSYILILVFTVLQDAVMLVFSPISAITLGLVGSPILISRLKTRGPHSRIQRRKDSRKHHRSSIRGSRKIYFIASFLSIFFHGYHHSVEVA